LEDLRELEQVLNEKGEEAFKDELIKANSRFYLPSFEALLLSCNRASTSCLVKGLQSLEQAAEEHKSEIKKDGHLPLSGLVPE